MITIRNKRNSFTVDETALKREKNYLNYVGVDEHCEIVMSFVYNKKHFKKNISKIQKCLASAGDSRGDELKDYINLQISSNEVLLSDEDYEEVERLFRNMSVVDTRRKEIIINSYAPIIAYECNRYFNLSELEDEVDVEFVYDIVCCNCLFYYEKKIYKKEILDKAKEILKTEYNVNLDLIFNGGNKQ